jgi:hypothetical protein
MRGPFFLSAFIAAVVLFAAIKTVFGQTPQPTPPPMVIEPADADAFRSIVAKNIPSYYNQEIIAWYNILVQRQQEKARAVAETKAKPGDEPK